MEDQQLEEPVERSIDNAAEQRRWRALVPTILTIVVVVGAAIAANIPYQLKEVHFQNGGSTDHFIDFRIYRNEPPVVAGFPYRFMMTQPASEMRDTPERSVFSFKALMGNVIWILGLGVPLVFYALRYARRTSKQNSRGGVQVTLADGLVLMLLIALPLGWWQWNKREFELEQALISRVRSAQGRVATSAWVPSWVADRTPTWFSKSFVKMRGVQIENPGAEVADQLLGRRSLTLLRLGGGDYNIHWLHRLPKMRHLVDLRIGGRKPTVNHFRSIARIPNLTSLGLPHCDIRLETLDPLGDCETLRSINLAHTPVYRDDFRKAAFKGTLKHLILPRPPSSFRENDAGESSRIVLSEWQNLVAVNFYDYESLMNSIPMEIEFQDLPRLKKIRLDPFQKFSIKLSNVPEFEEFAVDWFNPSSRRTEDTKLPGHYWVENFEIENAPKLKEVTVYAPGVDRFEVRDVPSLETFNVTAFELIIAGQNFVKLSSDETERLLDGLSKCDLPAKIDLEAVEMGPTDLSRLAQANGPKKLLLGRCGLDGESLLTLRGAKELRSLQAYDAAVTSSQLNELVRGIDSLEELSVKLVGENARQESYEDFSIGSFAGGLSEEAFYGPVSLELKDHPNLRKLEIAEGGEYLTQLTIENCPQLEFEVTTSIAPGGTIRLVDSPRLQAIVVPEPLHAGGIQLNSSLNALKRLAVGGEGVTPEFLKTLGALPQCEELTLISPAIDAESFGSLVLPPNLRTLALVDCDLRDDGVANWKVPQSLETLNLSRSRVASKGLERLLSSPDLLHVDLSHLETDTNDWLVHLKSEWIESLSLANTQVSIQGLSNRFPEWLRLKTLFLDNVETDGPLMPVLNKLSLSLEFIGLSGCEIDGPSILGLLGSRQVLSADIPVERIPVNMAARWADSGRILSYQNYLFNRMMERQIQNQGNNVNMMGMAMDWPDESPRLGEQSISVDAFFEPYSGGAAAINVQPTGPMAPGAVGTPVIGGGVNWVTGLSELFNLVPEETEKDEN
ncbi:MAG: hypothetical protein AAF664_00675 [Planctomycetota bacterium]